MRRLGVLAFVAAAVLVSGCSGESGSAQTTTTTVAEETTTTAVPETTTTTVVEETSTTVQEAAAPDPTKAIVVYSTDVRSAYKQTESTEVDGVKVLTIEYSDTIEMSDPRASGTAEWTALLYSPLDQGLVGGTWTSEGGTLTNDGGTWVGYRVGAYILTQNMPSALTTDSGVVTGEAHYIGQGGYEGLRMDLYTSSDGIIGTIGPLEDLTEEESPLEGVAATADTTMVHGAWTESTSTQTKASLVDGIEVVTIDYSEVLEMSDPRVSGTMDYTTTLSVLKSSVGGTWVNETVAIVNEAGTWEGEATGAFVYAKHMPDALTPNDGVIIGEWHFTGTGEYEGLRLDIYNSSDGVTGSIRPAN